MGPNAGQEETVNAGCRYLRASLLPGPAETYRTPRTNVTAN